MAQYMTLELEKLIDEYVLPALRRIVQEEFTKLNERLTEVERFQNILREALHEKED
jgi:hypothetical protein